MKKLPTVLRRLGPIPFWRGEEKCLDALARLYTRAMEAAERRLASAPTLVKSVPGAPSEAQNANLIFSDSVSTVSADAKSD